jgi:hypothetical protein
VFEVAFGFADVKEIGWAEPVDDGLDATGLLEVVDCAFQFGSATGDAKQRDEMATGGCAPGDEFVWVEVVFFGVGAQPADGGFAILDLSGEFGFLTESVSNLGDSVAVFDETEGWAWGIFAAGHPCAAVNPDNEGKGFVSFLGQIQIQVHGSSAGLTVFQVLQLLCSGWQRRLGVARERGCEECQKGYDWFHAGSVGAVGDLCNDL